MEVICIEAEALYTLVEKVVECLKQPDVKEKKWLNREGGHEKT